MVYFQNLFLYGMAGAVVDRGVFCLRRCRIFKGGGNKGEFYPPDGNWRIAQRVVWKKFSEKERFLNEEDNSVGYLHDDA
ncbi:MAG: hypothetical protein II259_04425, partial [Selenomonadaceae bacterium]|nr:hypothetical protein [Selenomonadaceae bacterium]